MRTLFTLFLSLCWTQVWAQSEIRGRYNSDDQAYEVTYDDLVQELSAKKSSLEDSPTQAFGFQKIQAVFGYSFSSMDINLKSGANSFALNGIDLRATGQMINSTWLLEGGFKNYNKVTSGEKSAENRIFTASVKNQDYLQANLEYVAGVSTSLHFINARDQLKSRNSINMSLNVTGGLRGPISNQLSWGVDLSAYSPISGGLLKGGFEAAFVLATVL